MPLPSTSHHRGYHDFCIYHHSLVYLWLNFLSIFMYSQCACPLSTAFRMFLHNAVAWHTLGLSCKLSSFCAMKAALLSNTWSCLNGPVLSILENRSRSPRVPSWLTDQVWNVTFPNDASPDRSTCFPFPAKMLHSTLRAGMSRAPSVIKDDICTNLGNKQQPAQWIGAESTVKETDKKVQPVFKSCAPWIT